MKPKKFGKKLTINKKTIANLGYSKMTKVIGGAHDTVPLTCDTCNTCITVCTCDTCTCDTNCEQWTCCPRTCT